MWSLQLTPIVGLPTYVDWSQATTFPLPSGKLIVLLSVRGQSAAVLGQSLLNEISAHTPDTVRALHEFLTDILEKHPEDAISIACLLLTEKKVTLGVVRASILLHRDENTGRVLPASDEVSVRSGTSKQDDVYILLNEQGEQFVAAIEQYFSQGLVVEAVATTLVPAVQSSADLSGTAAIALIEVCAKNAAPAKEVPEEKQTEPSVKLVAAQDLAELPKIIAAPTPSMQKKSLSVVRIVRRVLVHSKRTGIQLWLVLRSFNVRRNTVYVRSALHDQWRKRILLLVGVVLFIAIAVFGGWWWYRSQQAIVQKDLAPFVEQLTRVQQVVVDDPITARQDAAQVVAELEALARTKGKQRFFGTQYKDAFSQAQDILTAISGKVALAELPVFYDLRLAQSEMVTTTSHLGGTKGIFIDAEKKQVVVLDLASKQVQQYSLAEVPQVQATTVANDTLFLLGDGLWQLPLTEDSAVQEIKPVGDSNRAGTLLGSFGVYRYVLNPEKRNVFRYTQRTEDVSDPIGWIIDPLPVSYEDISSLTIDGDIWFGTTSGAIFRYASGRRETFEPTGLEEKFALSLLLETAEDATNLYVLEAEKQRLVILSKDGTFLREVRSPSIATVTSFFVDESGGFAYLTSGSTVYQVRVNP